MKNTSSQLLQGMEWRYATKQFNPTKKLSESDLNELISSTRLSPSSFGLPTWKILIVKDPNVRQKIKEAAWGQSQVTDASHLIIFLSKTNITEKDAKDYINLISKTRKVTLDSLKGFEEMLVGYIKRYSQSELSNWAKKQSYIGLGTLLISAAIKNIDSCPMEGFDPSKIDKILDLENSGWTTTTMCPLGYRAETDNYSSLSKVRIPLNEFAKSI